METQTLSWKVLLSCFDLLFIISFSCSSRHFVCQKYMLRCEIRMTTEMESLPNVCVHCRWLPLNIHLRCVAASSIHPLNSNKGEKWFVWPRLRSNWSQWTFFLLRKRAILCIITLMMMLMYVFQINWAQLWFGYKKINRSLRSYFFPISM